MEEKKYPLLGTIGHVDHGKTTLTAAISLTQAAQKPMAVIDKKNKCVIVDENISQNLLKRLEENLPPGFEMKFVSDLEAHLESDRQKRIKAGEEWLETADQLVPGMKRMVDNLIEDTKKSIKKAVAKNNPYEGKGGEVPADKTEKRHQIETRRQERWEKSQRGRK